MDKISPIILLLLCLGCSLNSSRDELSQLRTELGVLIQDNKEQIDQLKSACPPPQVLLKFRADNCEILFQKGLSSTHGLTYVLPQAQPGNGVHRLPRDVAFRVFFEKPFAHANYTVFVHATSSDPDTAETRPRAVSVCQQTPESLDLQLWQWQKDGPVRSATGLVSLVIY